MGSGKRYPALGVTHFARALHPGSSCIESVLIGTNTGAFQDALRLEEYESQAEVLTPGIWPCRSHGSYRAGQIPPQALKGLSRDRDRRTGTRTEPLSGQNPCTCLSLQPPPSTSVPSNDPCVGGFHAPLQHEPLQRGRADAQLEWPATPAALPGDSCQRRGRSTDLPPSLPTRARVQGESRRQTSGLAGGSLRPSARRGQVSRRDLVQSHRRVQRQAQGRSCRPRGLRHPVPTGPRTTPMLGRTPPGDGTDLRCGSDRTDRGGDPGQTPAGGKSSTRSSKASPATPALQSNTQQEVSNAAVSCPQPCSPKATPTGVRGIRRELSPSCGVPTAGRPLRWLSRRRVHATGPPTET